MVQSETRIISIDQSEASIAVTDLGTFLQVLTGSLTGTFLQGPVEGDVEGDEEAEGAVEGRGLGL